MADTINLSSEIEKQLPAELVSFMQTAGKIADKQGQSLYLVGGVVRDLLLGRSNFDLDLVVEGDAIKLAQRLADITYGKMIALAPEPTLITFLPHKLVRDFFPSGIYKSE